MAGSHKDPFAEMNTERPLDALFPELRAPGVDNLPKSLLHPRVLEVETDAGWEWVIAGWEDPGTSRALHQAARQLIEAAFLFELSQPAGRGVQTLDRVWSGMRMVLFTPTSVDVKAALQAFGFVRESWEPQSMIARLGAISEEARKVGQTLPRAPDSVWLAPVHRAAGEHGETLATLHRLLIERSGSELFGEVPGGPSRRLALAVQELFGETLRPDPDGLRALERLLVPPAVGALRWQPPMVFQALCDFVGVVLAHHFGRKVAWGVSEPEDTGFIPPPILRLGGEGGRSHHLPVGMHLLRWIVMPVQRGETVPSLADWMLDEFGTLPS